MTLSFSTVINGKPNYFIEKIWKSSALTNFYTDHTKGLYGLEYSLKFGCHWDLPVEEILFADIYPKLHTIRDHSTTKAGELAKKQWAAGDKIHPAINNRTKNYFQFAPTIECKSVQTILIKENITIFNKLPIREIMVFVDGKELPVQVWNQLAINDGFNSPIDFINYFSVDKERQLIHWTDLKY